MHLRQHHVLGLSLLLASVDCSINAIEESEIGESMSEDLGDEHENSIAR